jgi:hypothetical protein
MNYRRKLLEELPQEDTAIWSCTNESCNGWMRDNFAFDYVPTCNQCTSLMVSSVKMLPLIINTNRDMKSIKKGVLIG